MSIIVGGCTFDVPILDNTIFEEPCFWPNTNAGTKPIPLNITGSGGGYARGVNNSGQLVGYSITNSENTIRPFFWPNTNPATEPIPLNITVDGGGGDFGIAYGINNLGQIVGFISKGPYSYAVIWPDTNPTTEAIPLSLGGKIGKLYGINDSGQIVGSLNGSGEKPIFLANSEAEPTVLSLGEGGTKGEAYGINNLEEIVGYITYAGVDTPVIWANYGAEPTVLSLGGGGAYGKAYGINNLGEIVGSIVYPGVEIPVFWKKFDAVPIPLSLGVTGGSGVAFGINDPPTPTPTPPISNICFPAGTPVQTDQGLVSIELLDTRTHTINKNPIVHVTRTTTLDKYLIGFKQHALGRNMPHTTTLMTWDHKIMFEGQLVPAFRFLDYSDQVKKVKYNGETLYNVLLAGYGTMNINNLVCETLHPENIIAKLYSTNYTHAEQQTLVYQLNTSLKNKDINGYKAVVDKLTAKK
jgi:uncharacterized membrane protein